MVSPASVLSSANAASSPQAAPGPGTPAAQAPTGQAAGAPAQTGAPEAISPKLQALIQREKTAVMAERAAQEKLAAAERKAQEILAREARITEFESARKTPKKALELLGLSYDELTQAMLAEGDTLPSLQVKGLEEKMDSFLQSQEEEKRQQAETAKKQEEQKLAERDQTFRKEITDYLKGNAARYELISFEGEEDLVYGVISEHFERTQKAAIEKAELAGEPVEGIFGEVMSISDAADKVELHLEQKFNKALALPKVKGFLAPRPGTKAPHTPAAKPTTPPRQSPPTLNNQMSAPAPLRKTPLTDFERIQKAIAYARGLRT